MPGGITSGAVARVIGDIVDHSVRHVVREAATSTTSAASAETSGSDDKKKDDNDGGSSPLLFFVALGFGVVFTNLW